MAMKQQTPGRQQSRTRSGTEKDEDQRDAGEPLISQRGASDRRSYYRSDEKKKKVDRLFATNVTTEEGKSADHDLTTNRPIDFSDVTLNLE